MKIARFKRKAFSTFANGKRKYQQAAVSVGAGQSPPEASAPRYASRALALLPSHYEKGQYCIRSTGLFGRGEAFSCKNL